MEILIVDSSLAMRIIIKRILRQTNIGPHSTIEADNQRDGLALIKDKNPDLVICNWYTPELNGLDFLKSARASEEKVKFGFITTRSSSKMRSVAMDTGANFLISVPFTPDSFQSSIKPEFFY